MKPAVIILLVLSVCTLLAGAQSQRVGGECEPCGLMFDGMPKSFSWETSIADKSEPGEPLEVSGTIFRSDGTTPAADVILYVYHTDAQGHYSPSANQTHARRHGHLRGWMKSDKSGRYKFRTIRPAAYPNRADAMHIHPVVKEPDKNEYTIDVFLFDDDTLLSAADRSRANNRGGYGVMTLAKNKDGLWIGHRDIILGLNVPNYETRK